MNQKQDYIAVFDSGVGGISVLRHLRREFPAGFWLRAISILHEKVKEPLHKPVGFDMIQKTLRKRGTP